MDARRLRPAEWLALGSALALLALLFVGWYGERSAWEAFAVVDVALALGALMGVALALVTAARESPAIPVALAVITIVLAAVDLVLVLIRLAFPPGGDERMLGAYLGLTAVLALLAGAWWSLRDERGGVLRVPVQDRALDG